MQRNSEAANEQTPMRWRWIVLDVVLWCIAVVYIFYGLGNVPFHTDESIYIAQSESYFAVFVERDLSILTDLYNEETGRFATNVAFFHLTNPPMTNYLIGLTVAAAGYGLDDLPNPYRIQESRITNIEQGNVPTTGVLLASRRASAFLLLLTTAVLYAIGRILDGRRLAYVVAALFVFNPPVLSHGRRAMQEAPLMFVGMLLVLLGVLILRKRTQSRPIPLWQWGSFAVVCGIIMATKYTGAAYVVGVCAALVVSDVLLRDWGHLRRTVLALGGSGLVALVLFFAVTPQLWQDTSERLQESYQLRALMVTEQVEEFGDNGDIRERLWRSTKGMVTLRYRGYTKTLYDRLHVPFLLLAGVGLLVMGWRVWRDRVGTGILYLALLLPLLMWVGVLLATPLPWSRYYAPPIPLVVFLTGIGVFWIVDRVRIGADRMRLSRDDVS